MKYLLFILTMTYSFFSFSAEVNFSEGKEYIKNRAYDKAIVFFTKPAAEGNKEAVFHLAYSYHRLGDYKNAKIWYSKNLSSAASLFNLSLIERKLGDHNNSALYMLSSAKKYGVKHFYKHADDLDTYLEILDTASSLEFKIVNDMHVFLQEIHRYRASQDDNRNDKRWKISNGDFNLDGSFTYRDIWSGFKWCFFYIGDFIIFHSLYSLPSGFSEFFELGSDSYGGWLSAIISMLFFGLILSFMNRYQ